jgi:glycerol-3-phosphate dehydrogenase
VLPLPGGERPLEDIRAEAAEIVDDGVVREHLVQSYGTRWRNVWDVGESRPELRERVSSTHAVIGAEFVYAIEREMAVTLGDLLIRRTHLAFEMPDQAMSLAPVVMKVANYLSGSTSEQHDRAQADYHQEVIRTFGVAP